MLYGKILLKVKVKVTLEQATKAQRGNSVYLYCFFSLCDRWGGWSTPRFGRFSVPRAPGPVWMGAKDLAYHRDSILRPSSP